jgi:hypothetical protein
LPASAQQLEERRSEFTALELPRQYARELQRRFDAACARCRDAIARQRALDAQRVWQDLLEAGNTVRALALGVLAHAGPDDLAALRGQAETAIARVTRWPKGMRALIDRQLERAGAGTPDADLAANHAVLRSLCVRAEILVDAPSPPADQALRQQQQLQRLVQAMGQGVRQEAGQFEALMLEWLAVGPTEASTYAELAARFGRCCQASTPPAGG